MTERVYDDDAMIDDKLSCDQIEVSCVCGYTAAPLWGRWPRDVKLTPPRKIQPRMVCQRCGKRQPTIVIMSYAGGRMRPVWQWPKA